MRAYTRMDTNLHQKMKKLRCTADYFFAAARKSIRSGLFSEEQLGSLVLPEVVALRIDERILVGDALHLFMPDREFCDWLVSCVPYLERKHAAVVADLLHDGVGVLHFPTDSKLISVGFLIPKITADLVSGIQTERTALFMSYSAGNPTEDAWAYCRLVDTPDGGGINQPVFSEQSTYYLKLVVGLGMYLSCFPEQQFDGIPNDLKHPHWFRHELRHDQCRTVGVSEDVVEREGMSPHYRVGHFMFLQSERYIYKRGQTVFRKGCFVKGKPKTVLAPGEENAPMEGGINETEGREAASPECAHAHSALGGG